MDDLARYLDSSFFLCLNKSLARRKAIHTKVCLVRVISKVLRNLENPQELDDYLRCIGRLHQLAGVDQTYLKLSGKSFCEALDSIQQHKELWSQQVGLRQQILKQKMSCLGEGYMVSSIQNNSGENVGRLLRCKQFQDYSDTFRAKVI